MTRTPRPILSLLPAVYTDWRFRWGTANVLVGTSPSGPHFSLGGLDRKPIYGLYAELLHPNGLRYLQRQAVGSAEAGRALIAAWVREAGGTWEVSNG